MTREDLSFPGLLAGAQASISRTKRRQELSFRSREGISMGLRIAHIQQRGKGRSGWRSAPARVTQPQEENSMQGFGFCSPSFLVERWRDPFFRTTRFFVCFFSFMTHLLSGLRPVVGRRIVHARPVGRRRRGRRWDNENRSS